ncbi:MAG: aspartate carbamoyltransferase catalytic subunit [Fusobacteriota bacterium]
MIKDKNIVGIDDLTKEEVFEIFETAKIFKKLGKKDNKKTGLLRGRTIINLFFENSTRTKSSFEISGKRLGADVINMSLSTSSIKKGESLMDTAKTLNAMSSDLYIMRHPIGGTVKMFEKYIDGSIINAGDGENEHPTQALLDVFTMLENFDTIEGLNIAIVGDIMHSRVAKSNIYLLQKLGANVTLVGPETLLPMDFKKLGVEVTDDIDSILGDMDALNLLRLQLERQGESFFPSVDEYHKIYGMNKARLDKMKDEAIILHPGPLNRGVEIDFDIADGNKQVILDQVENGVAIRKALLYLILNGDELEEI